jgi:hypothetical protein
MKKNTKYIFIGFFLNVSFSSEFLQKIEKELSLISIGNYKIKIFSNFPKVKKSFKEMVKWADSLSKFLNKINEPVDMSPIEESQELHIKYFKQYFNSIENFNYSVLKNKINNNPEKLAMALLIGFNINKNSINIILNNLSPEEKIIFFDDLYQMFINNFNFMKLNLDYFKDNLNKIKDFLFSSLGKMEIQKEFILNNGNYEVEITQEFCDSETIRAIEIIDPYLNLLEKNQEAWKILSTLKNSEEMKNLIENNPEEFFEYFQTYLLFRVFNDSNLDNPIVQKAQERAIK